MQQTYRYRNIIIKPHWMQFVINELHLFMLISVDPPVRFGEDLPHVSGFNF